MIRFLRIRIAGERGAALPMVIGMTLVLGLLVTTAVTYATGGFRQSAATEEWSASLAAAYAGVEDYQSRLSEDTSYIQYGNPAAKFSISTGSSVRLPNSSNVNPAFNTAVSETWAVVPGGNGDSQYRYEVDNSQYSGSGIVRIRSTGKVGGETRSLVADLRQSGFIDFLYFTDYEIKDPALSGASSSCLKYAWAGRGSNCGEIAFGSGDVIDGPAHSNDTLRVCQATFKGDVTTSYKPTSGLRFTPKDSNGYSCNGQNFEKDGSPSFQPVIGMPATNSQHLRETRTDLASDGVPRPGCLYTGPTQITMNSNGTITVLSPWTKKTRIVGSPATSGSTPAECGDVTRIVKNSGDTFTMPANNVIYVQNVPAVSSDPNSWRSWEKPAGLTCTGQDGSTDRNGNGNGIGYPVRYEEAESDAYGCKTGDMFVKGTVNGQATLSAERYIYVTGDIKYKSADSDVLGLVGNDAVWVWNPVYDPRYYNSTILSDSGRRIDAAILSVGHTFAVQNPGTGSGRGTLTVNGAIAQKFRGIVKRGSGGYTKNYVYDNRLLYTAPPKFLSPVTTTYGVNVWIEVKPAYDSTGKPTP
ncbi:hypothetical protein [Salinibacterium sp. M195]|uniref:hypothetical protein n=1 Tax=Salinibacterium sp. M195 TaxID=2583374 RepID=UPI001C639E10|nr:hypothetical protein [Salinibacterium sp. M195]QYH35329.1 hypothetical protein FFT87_04830 [Salinibacterium sp. M195]